MSNIIFIAFTLILVLIIVIGVITALGYLVSILFPFTLFESAILLIGTVIATAIVFLNMQ
ncbi:hypothetical protein TI05_11495 [Achromatium sp. WMS3]|nr:hypothetical protein TI05_11495 [Achromatium sp. WMS3]